MGTLLRFFHIVRVLIHSIAIRISWLPALLSRLVLGAAFLLAGTGKLYDLSPVQRLFAEYGIPMSRFFAPAVSVVEIGCGAALIMGLWVRIATVPLIGVLIAAIFAAHRFEIDSLWTFVMLPENLLILHLVWLFTAGAGSVSMDYFLARSLRRRVAGSRL